MRTTLDLPDPLFREVKARAAQSGLKLKELLTRNIEAGLRARPLPAAPLDRGPSADFRRAFRRCPPGLSNAELQALIDDEDIEDVTRVWDGLGKTS